MHTFTGLLSAGCNCTGPAQISFTRLSCHVLNSCWHCKSFSWNKFAPQSKKKILICIKYRGATVDCVDTTMFPLQATVFFSSNRAVFNGSVFARGVWSCFPMLDHEERWRASIDLSSYHTALGRSNQGGFVPLCVSLCRWYHFVLCSALLCRQRLPSTLLWFERAVPWLSAAMFSANCCNISGTNVSTPVTANPPRYQHTQLHGYMLSCLVFIGTLCNK